MRSHAIPLAGSRLLCYRLRWNGLCREILNLMFPIKSNSPDPETFTQKPLNSEFAKEVGFLCDSMQYPLQEVDFYVTVYAPKIDSVPGMDCVVRFLISCSPSKVTRLIL
jgi:hypothetical protein